MHRSRVTCSLFHPTALTYTAAASFIQLPRHLGFREELIGLLCALKPWTAAPAGRLPTAQPHLLRHCRPPPPILRPACQASGGSFCKPTVKCLHPHLATPQAP